MSKANAMTGAERKASLLETGAKLAAKHGATNVTRRMVAKEAGVSEALVSRYFADGNIAQKAYARKAKAMGLKQPTKEAAATIGAKLRAHGPRAVKSTRKRSAKEVQAIKRNVGTATVKRAKEITAANTMVKPEKVIGKKNVKALRTMDKLPVVKRAAKKASKPGPAETKPTAPPLTKPTAPPTRRSPQPASKPAQAPPATKTAARQPLAPPVAVTPSQSEPVALPAILSGSLR